MDLRNLWMPLVEVVAQRGGRFSNVYENSLVAQVSSGFDRISVYLEPRQHRLTSNQQIKTKF